MKIKLTDTQVKKLVTEDTQAPLTAPLPGSLSVNSRFSKKRCLSGQKCRAHNGTDYKASSGTQALAISDGTVSRVKPDSGRCGGTIIVKHTNGYISSYCHMKRISVTKGQSVTRGDVLGNTGGSSKDYGRGNSMGAHLHFGLKYNGKWVVPEKHIDKTNILAGGIEEVRPEGVIVMRGDGIEGEPNDKVREIQTLLVARNYILPRFGVDGKFGPETEAAVKAFQADYMSTQTGQVDIAMEEKLQDTTSVNLKPERNDLTQVKKLSQEGEFDNFSPVVKDAITSASIKHGINVDVLATIANIESGGNPGAINKSSKASGLYQVLPRYFKDYGLTTTTVFNPTANADKAALKLKEKIITLNSYLGRAPTPSELYVSHNQGTAGFKIIRLACDSFGNMGGLESLNKAALQLGYNKTMGKHVFNNMRGNKGDSPCMFLDTWSSIYASKQLKMGNLA